MLRAEAHRQVAEPGVERGAGAAAHDVDVGARERREPLEEVTDLRGRSCEHRMRHELAQRSVVVEQERSPASALQPACNLGLSGLVEAVREVRLGLSRETSKALQELAGPVAAIELEHAVGHQLEPSCPLRLVEGEGLQEPHCEVARVPRVHEQRAREDLGGSGELAEEQRPGVASVRTRAALAKHELLCDEVHAVAERRDHHHIGAPVQGDELGHRDRAVYVLDRGRTEPAEPAVQVSDPLLDLVALGGVFGALEARGNEHLDQRRRLGPLRLEVEDPLERVDLLGDPLGVVEPLDAEDDLLAAVALLHLRLDLRRLRATERRAERLDVDPDREGADPDDAAVEVDLLRPGLHPEDPQAGGAEVPDVVAGMEADVVGAEHPAEELSPRGKEAVDLGRGKRHVQEEADREIGPTGAERSRQQREMEVVDPHGRSAVGDAGDRVREALVDGDVARPRVVGEAQAADEVVEERPDRLVAHARVIAFGLGLGQEHREVPFVVKQRSNHALRALGHGAPRPTDPHVRLGEPAQRRYEAAGARRDAGLPVVVQLHGHGQPIAGDDKRRRPHERKVPGGASG